MYGTKNPIEMNIDMFFDRTGVALAIVPWFLWDIMTAQTKPSPTDSAGFSSSFLFQLRDWTGGNGQEPGAVRPDCLRRLGLGCLSSGLATGFWSWLLRLDETNRDTVRSVPSGKPSKLTWQWQMDPDGRCISYVIFHCHVSLLEGIYPGSHTKTLKIIRFFT